MKFVKATKSRSKLRLALIGLAGSGKTYSALSVAQHLVPSGRVAVIDTERGSASLYADRFTFDVLELDRHRPEDYIAAIGEAESAGFDVVVIDSLSHAWAGREGALEQVDRIAKREGMTSNFRAWRDVTPQHGKLVDAMLSCRSHLIATMRSKMEYAMEPDEKGRMSVRKIGLAPIQREGLDYEFTIVGDLNLQHQLVISKSRCSVIVPGDVIESPGEKMATQLRGWLDDGAEPERVIVAPGVDPARIEAAISNGHDAAEPLSELDAEFAAWLGELVEAPTIAELDRIAILPAKPNRPPHGVPSRQYDLAVKAYRDRMAYLKKQELTP